MFRALWEFAWGVKYRNFGGLGSRIKGYTWRPKGLSKSVTSRVAVRVTPFRVLVTLLITHLLGPLGLQVGVRV